MKQTQIAHKLYPKALVLRIARSGNAFNNVESSRIPKSQTLKW